MRSRPAAASAPACRPSVTPLVVRDSSGRGASAASERSTSGSVGWTSGSPPVRRMLRTPSSTNRFASRTNSASVSRCALVSQSSPSAGMQ